jgi:hypothetical protein
LAYLHTHQPFPDVRCKAPEVPHGLCQVLARGAEKDPRRRYQSGMELMAALDTLALDALLGAPGQSASSLPRALPAGWPFSVGPRAKPRGLAGVLWSRWFWMAALWSLVVVVLTLSIRSQFSSDEPDELLARMSAVVLPAADPVITDAVKKAAKRLDIKIVDSTTDPADAGLGKFFVKLAYRSTDMTVTAELLCRTRTGRFVTVWSRSKAVLHPESLAAGANEIFDQFVEDVENARSRN